MSAGKDFKIAAVATNVGAKILYLVICLSAVLLFFPLPVLEAWLHPVLIASAMTSIGCSIVTSIYQTAGNRELRESQLTDALGASICQSPPADYYNSSAPPSIGRLAITTLENTFFTSAVLTKMLLKERIRNSVYLILFVLLASSRETTTSLILFLSQLIFSADVVLSWLRLERFNYRVCLVQSRLQQFFLQGGDITTPNGLAIALASFTDYECAKDEVSTPLDSGIFKRLNTKLSLAWAEEKKRLKIS